MGIAFTVNGSAREVDVPGATTLLETLAHRIARDVLAAFPARRIAVRVRKRPASLKEKLDHVEVEVEQVPTGGTDP